MSGSNVHTHPTEGHWKFFGGGRGSQSQLGFLEGWGGVQTQKTENLLLWRYGCYETKTRNLCVLSKFNLSEPILQFQFGNNLCTVLQRHQAFLTRWLLQHFKDHFLQLLKSTWNQRTLIILDVLQSYFFAFQLCVMYVPRATNIFYWCELNLREKFPCQHCYRKCSSLQGFR